MKKRHIINKISISISSPVTSIKPLATNEMGAISGGGFFDGFMAILSFCHVCGTAKRQEKLQEMGLEISRMQNYITYEINRMQMNNQIILAVFTLANAIINTVIPPLISRLGTQDSNNCSTCECTFE